MVVRMVRRILTSLARRMIGTMSPAEQWERSTIVPSLPTIARGARHPFPWYFDGASEVSVASLDEIHAWLSTCSYVPDAELFQERDFWQHPVTFERLRAGDCEDFALWAWRKLLELQYDATFIIGYSKTADGSPGRHAWLVVTQDGVEYLYEPAWKDLTRAFRPLRDVMEHYTPEFGVGRDLQAFTFMGRAHAVLGAG